MNLKAVLSILSVLLFASAALAQWQSTDYTLKGGWNSIYLNGDAPGDIGTLMPNAVLEVWRWNSNPTQMQFTESPLIPSAGTPEWSVWVRGSQSELSTLSGQASYLVRCAGTSANTYTVRIKQSPLPPKNSWVRNGANLLGFPTFKNGNNYPAFSSYFATFPAAIAANTKIYKYVGGELGAGNPLQVFSATSERIDRTQAYWFSAEVVGNFYAPIEISLSTNNGLSFGRTGAEITARIRNRTSAAVTLTLTPAASESAPAGQPDITGAVPLTLRTFNTTTLRWSEDAITAASHTKVLGPQSTVELSFGINRVDPAMSGAASGALFASFLRLTDSSNLMEVFLPVTAQKASLAGLWVGDISVNHVNSRVSNTAQATATVTDGVVSAVAVSGSGGYGYTSAPTVTIDDPASGTAATATAIVTEGAVTGFTLTSGGSGYAISPKVTIAPPPPLAGTSTPRPMQLRTLLHVADDGTARLLSKIFLGRLAAAPQSFGLCTQETLLKQDARDKAQRLVAAHLPLDQVITSGSGSVAIPGVLVRTITIPYNDATNPFVHQYHPDHDNRDARFQAVGNGVESHSVARTCTFTFTPSPPGGGSSSGWGSSVIGGTYSETITGLHKDPIQIDGTFVLRRASELGALSTN